MAAERLPQQIVSVKAGDKLQFIRDVFDGDVRYTKKRVVYVLETDKPVVMIGMPTPMKGITGEIMWRHTFSLHGFKFCRFIRPELLLENCRRLED